MKSVYFHNIKKCVQHFRMALGGNVGSPAHTFLLDRGSSNEMGGKLPLQVKPQIKTDFSLIYTFSPR